MSSEGNIGSINDINKRMKQKIRMANRKEYVSVIIPTYNRAGHLLKAINSLLGQTYPYVEIIVVDDGSTDNTKNIIDHLGANITYIKTQHKGTSHARNIGMKAATGKYIAFLDSDDKYLPYKLELQVDFMEAHPEIGMVFTEFSGHQKNGHIDKYFMRIYHSIWERNAWSYETIFKEVVSYYSNIVNDYITYYAGNIFKYVLMDTLIPTNTILMPKKNLDVVGFQNESYRFAQEYEYAVRICKHYKVAFLNIPTYVIFMHDNQSTRFIQEKNNQTKSKTLLEINAMHTLLSTVIEWGYKDKEYYNKNSDLIISRIVELNLNIGKKWLIVGDRIQARKFFWHCHSFTKIETKHFIYYILTFMPNRIREYILLKIYAVIYFLKKYFKKYR